MKEKLKHAWTEIKVRLLMIWYVFTDANCMVISSENRKGKYKFMSNRSDSKKVLEILSGTYYSYKESCE